MGISADLEAGIDVDGRVIDRSGDIDQRPPEERTGKDCANVVAFRREERPCQLPAPAALYVAAPLPAQGFKAPPRELADIAQRLQKDLDKQYAKAKSQLETLTQKIEAQERRCVPPKLDGDLQQIRFQRQKLLIANGPALADCLREEKSSLACLESFKAEHRLTRDAHYPSSPLLAFGIISMLVIMEAGINGVLFADSSDQGLFGGWLEALVLSITNVGAAFLFGRMVLPQLHRRGPGVKAGAFVLCLAGVAAILAINLVGAHYRDFKSEAGPDPAPPIVLKHEASLTLGGGAKPGPAAATPRKAAKPAPAESPAPVPAPIAENERNKEREAVAKLLRSPFAFDSFMSFFLFVIGLCGACIAALDGYKLDDPFPGYGKRHRKYASARLRGAAALQRILGQSNAIMTGSFQAINRKIENFAYEMSALLNLHQAYAGDRKELQDGLQEAAEDAEAQIAAYERLLNKVPVPGEARDVYSVALKTLPSLSEKQVKFHETQERKLKSLQKAAQKEQGDVLGLFEAASADFQKLLADASRTSLRAALAVPCEEASGREAGA